MRQLSSLKTVISVAQMEVIWNNSSMVYSPIKNNPNYIYIYMLISATSILVYFRVVVCTYVYMPHTYVTKILSCSHAAPAKWYKKRWRLPFVDRVHIQQTSNIQTFVKRESKEARKKEHSICVRCTYMFVQ